jgi:hypothetical protein
MTFQERLKLELTLTIGGQSFAIPGGQINRFAIRLANHGFTASVSFWTSLEKDSAPLLTAFRKQDLIQVRLSAAGTYPTEGTPPAPLVVQGLSRTRSLGGRTHGPLEGEERSFRHYSLEFADAAQVLWGQHRPIELHTQKTMADLIEAHKAGPLKLTYDWDELQAELPMLCLALGADDPRTSFYDFVLGYVHSLGGVWTYDSQKDEYVLSGTKSQAGRAAVLRHGEVARIEVQAPPSIRHRTRLLNGAVSSPKKVVVDQAQAAQGISQDVLLRTPIASDLDQREAREKSRLRLRQRRLGVLFQQFPTVAVHSGALLRLEGGLWSSELKGTGEDLRVLSLNLEGQALHEGPHDGQQETTAGYQVRMEARLEQKSDPVPTLPPFRVPRYPIYVEAKVHSPGGAETDRTWFIVEDQKTSTPYYRMTVPLWNKTVSVPAEPNRFPGHFYFPPYKNARVLLALYFDRAELHRFLDWSENVRMPQDGQGDQMLLGKNKTSQTSLSHDFQDSNPVWRLHRVSEGDTQTLRIAEGAMLLQVKEKPGTAAATATYDVTPQVETAKGDLGMAVGGAIGETTAAYQASTGNVRARIDGASAETVTALQTAQAEVDAMVAAAKAELNSALQALSGRAGSLAGTAAEAKAALEKLR